MSGLSKKLEGKFEMVGVEPGPIRLRNGRTIDTRSCSIRDVEEAIKAGSSSIKKVEKTPASASKKDTNEKKKG